MNERLCGASCRLDEAAPNPLVSTLRKVESNRKFNAIAKISSFSVYLYTWGVPDNRLATLFIFRRKGEPEHPILVGQ
jgi:hypothetical protein